jgi:hypothetical protein
MEEGGLNIKNLEIQNSCLLKFIHKFHSPNDSSWAKWIHNYVYKGNKHTTTKMVYGNTPPDFEWCWLVNVADTQNNRHGTQTRNQSA